MSKVYEKMMSNPIVVNMFDKSLLSDGVVEDVRLWISSLRSGEYMQGRDMLYSEDRYCCLGVADKVCNLHESSVVSLAGTHSMMGLRHQEGAFTMEDGAMSSTLVGLNDTCNLTFLQIADIIERHLNEVLQ